MSEQRERERGEQLAGAFIVVSEGNNGLGKEAGLGLSRLNNFCGLWGRGTVPSHLVSGPGVIRTG